MGTVGSNVIFAIGATGASATAGKFAIVGAAIVAVGKAVKDVIADAERFADTFTRMSDEQVKAAMAMDKATAGVVDTHAALQSQVRLTEAGLGSNAKLMEAIGKLAGDMAQKLGEGPEGVTNRVNRLTDAISKGQTRALKEYGIDLENTEDLLLAQSEATDKVIDRASALNELQLRTAEEGWSRLQNDIGTTIGLLWSGGDGSGGLVDAFNKTHDGIGAFNNLLMSPETGEAFRSYMFSIEGVNTALQTLKGWLTGNTDAVGEFTRKVADALDRAKALQSGNIFGYTPETTGGEGSVFDPTAKVMGADTGKKKTPKKRGGGGGRRKKEPTYDYDFTQPQIEIAEGAIEAFESLEAEKERIEQEAFMRRLDSLKNYTASAQEINEQKWTHELYLEQTAEEYERQRHEWRMERMGTEQARRVTDMEMFFGVEQAHLDASFAMWQSGVQGRAEMISGFFGTMAQGMEAFGRKGWKAAKAFMILEAAAGTISAAIQSYKSLAGIPYVGPVLGALAAAATTAWGLKRISTISKMKYGDAPSVGGDAAPAVGGGGGGAGAAQNNIGGAGQQPTTIVVNVEGSLSHAITGINAAYTDKVKSGEWSGWGSEGA